MFALPQIAILLTAALLYTAVIPPRGRDWFLLGGSVIAIYWLQPYLPIRFSGFILPTATLALSAVGWWLTLPTAQRQLARPWWRDDNLHTAVFILALLLLLTLVRELPPAWRPWANRPPALAPLLIGLCAVALPTAAGLWLLRRRPASHIAAGGFILVALLFVALKTAPLATAIAALWRSGLGQETAVASPADLQWLGFSYVIFRLLHTLRDRQTGQLPALTLREYIGYMLFAPAFVAGPIDRAERFVADWRNLPTLERWSAQRWQTGLGRIALGLGKKFVLADSLAIGVSLTAANASQTQSTPWLWVLLYGYGWRLFWDFSGYTDIALGLGQLFGISLPENFRQPYRQRSLAAFWQSWHITLGDWARFYVFSPLSRTLLRRKPRPSPLLVVLACQLATMLVIGLWHGVAPHFVVWGVWHGLGLFVAKQWTDRTRLYQRTLSPRAQTVWGAAGWFFTFHYVMLGWVWFAIPDLPTAAQTLTRLFGWW